MSADLTPSILVVDDEQNIRTFISSALEDEGYHVIEAANGLDALNHINGHPLCLIILDMRMPVMDGWKFLEQYSETPEPHAPVLAFSANLTSTTLPEGIIGFLPKPFNLIDLLNWVAKTCA